MSRKRASEKLPARHHTISLVTTAGISAGLVLAAGCSSADSARVEASAPESPRTAVIASPSTFPLTSAAPGGSSSTAQPAAVPAASQSAAVVEACAAFADNTFIYVRTVATARNGSLTLSANPVTVVCGGPDDVRYDVSSTKVTCFVAPTASISIFDLAAMRSEPIPAGKFGAYLATDRGTRMFLVTGVLTAIYGLVEQYHP
jgi:hypothetical protein